MRAYSDRQFTRLQSTPPVLSEKRLSDGMAFRRFGHVGPLQLVQCLIDYQQHLHGLNDSRGSRVVGAISSLVELVEGIDHRRIALPHIDSNRLVRVDHARDLQAVGLNATQRGEGA